MNQTIMIMMAEVNRRGSGEGELISSSMLEI